MNEEIKIPVLTPRKIMEQVCWDYHISLDDLLGEGRDSLYVSARVEIYRRLRREMKMNNSAIAKILGRNHASIVNYSKKIV